MLGMFVRIRTNKRKYSSMRLMEVIGFFLVLLTSANIYASDSANLGSFIGELEVSYARDGNSVELLRDIGYEDPNGKIWTALKGLTTDGATIPRVVWTLVGSPLKGSHIRAAVVHDQYCSIRNEPPELVHRMFYDALRASGVNNIKASIMYIAVRVGGPSWSAMDVKNAKKYFRAKYFNQDVLDSPTNVINGRLVNDVYIKGTYIHNLCSDQECTIEKIESFEDAWITGYLKEFTKVKNRYLGKRDLAKIVSFVELNQPGIVEIERYIDDWGRIPGSRLIPTLNR